MPPKGKNPKMARKASKNPRWKGGISSDYQRRITNAKKGELVHHKNHNRKDNRKSNLVKLKPTKNKTAIGVHNARHPEKGRKKK